MGFLDSLDDALKTLGESAIAAPGFVYDVATMPFDDKDDNFGTLLNAASKRASDFATPLGSAPGTPGWTIWKAVEAANTVYHEAIDQPLSTAALMLDHSGLMGNVFTADYAALVDGRRWAEAYRIAEHQSFGQSLMTNADPVWLDGIPTSLSDSSDIDPLSSGELPYQKGRLYREHPYQFTGLSVGADLTAAWYLDPAVALGKGVSAYRQFQTLGKLTAADRATFMARLEGKTDSVTGLRGRDWSNRLDEFFDFVSGNNHLQRPLNAYELFHISPELKHNSAAGRMIASEIAGAARLESREDGINAMRRIYAVAAGDPSQVARLMNERAEVAATADALSNLVEGRGVTRLGLQALNKDIGSTPEFTAEMSRQIRNLDGADELTEFATAWKQQMDAKLKAQDDLLSIRSGMDFVPGKHLNSDMKLKSVTGDGALDKVSRAHDAALEAAHRAAKRESYTSVYQRSLYNVPLIVAKPIGWAASPFTKGLPAANNALRQTHFTGVANLNDWSGATDQLDSMMRIAGVDDAARTEQLSKAFSASTEMEKKAAIIRAERASMEAFRLRAGGKLGREIDPGWIDALFTEYAVKRGRAMSQASGSSIYATTAAPEGMAQRLTGWRDANIATKADEAKATGTAGLPEGEVAWRVDQIPDEYGVPVSLPVMSSQLADRVPLFDASLADRLTSDAVAIERLQKMGEAYRAEILDWRGLKQQYARAIGTRNTGVAARLERAITAKRAALDGLVEMGGMLTRWWKFSVLFRAGYPMRVIADDHMRIAAKMGYGTFLNENIWEAGKNAWRNQAPAFVYGNGRRGQALAILNDARAQRHAALTSLGREKNWRGEEWDSLVATGKTLFSKKATAEEKAAAAELRAKLDPDGRVSEWLDHRDDATRLRRSIAAHQKNIAKWEEEIENGGDAAALNAKITKARFRLTDAEGSLAAKHEWLAAANDPEEMRQQIRLWEDMITGSTKLLRPAKTKLGEADLELGLTDSVTAPGIYSGKGATYRDVAGSRETYDNVVTDGEASIVNRISSGVHRTVRASEPGHLQVWADVLNHQVLNSPEMMVWVRGEVTTPAEFAAWLKQPANEHLRRRVPHYAHDPEDWGSRLQELFHDYVPTAELRDELVKGRVSPAQLAKMFPENGPISRPDVHGQLVDVNTGRNPAVRYMGNTMNAMMEWLATKPTDILSRHPYMNAVYKQEMREQYEVLRLHKAETGGSFTSVDMEQMATVARQKALAELKRTLWDVSAHSHAAHVMRFVSPFFAAHQEALTRWWRIVTDDPSVARRFQLSFDAPRHLGLTYDVNTGEPVKPGEPISSDHRVLIRLPWADGNGAVAKWLQGLGMDRGWSMNENGFNLVLQNGVTNPGVGPVVSVPLEAAVQRYAGEKDLEAAARALNPYPPDSVESAVLPAWARRAKALMEGEGNREWNSAFYRNTADLLTQWRIDHGGIEPTRVEMERLIVQARQDTNRDLVLMMTSNLTSPAPAKPGSKFAVVQRGWQKIQSQGRAEGHDFEWMREQFINQYGAIYSALMYSQTSNPSKLDARLADVRAVRRHKSLLGSIDPSAARVVVGPAAAMDIEADPDLERYSPAARRFLMKTKGRGGESFLLPKDANEAAVSSMISNGWLMYEQLVNALQVEAEKRGFTSYDQDASLVRAKSIGLEYIKTRNFAWRDEWDSYDRNFEDTIDDLRVVAADKDLSSDPTRQDIYWLGQYLLFRDMVTEELKRRREAGGSASISAQSNADLARVFGTAVLYIRHQNTYFDDYTYHGLLERDPYAQVTLGHENGDEQ